MKKVKTLIIVEILLSGCFEARDRKAGESGQTETSVSKKSTVINKALKTIGILTAVPVVATVPGVTSVAVYKRNLLKFYSELIEAVHAEKLGDGKLYQEKYQKVFSNLRSQNF